MIAHPFPLSGGAYRLVDGQLVSEDDAPAVADRQAEAATTESGDAAAAPAEPPVTRRRSKHED